MGGFVAMGPPRGGDAGPFGGTSGGGGGDGDRESVG